MSRPRPEGGDGYDLDEAVDKIAKHYGVPTAVWKKMRAQESGGDPSAVSAKGARNEWQFMPETSKLYKVDESDPLDRARGAMEYLSNNYKKFRKYAKNEKHAWMTSVAGYHTNPANVEKDLKKGGYGLPKISDGAITTRDHVLKIFDGLDDVYDRSPLGTVDANPSNSASYDPNDSEPRPAEVKIGGVSPETYASEEEIAQYEAKFGKVAPGVIPDSARKPQIPTTSPTIPVPSRLNPQAAPGQTEQNDPSQPRKLSLKTATGSELVEADDPTPVPAGKRRLVDKANGKTYLATEGTRTKTEQGESINYNIEREIPDYLAGKSKPNAVLMPNDPAAVQAYKVLRDHTGLPDTAELRRRFIAGYEAVKRGERTEIFSRSEQGIFDDIAALRAEQAEKQASAPKQRGKAVQPQNAATQTAFTEAPTTASELPHYQFEKTGKLTLNNGTELALVKDAEGSAAPAGFARFQDADGETYLFDKASGKLKDESLAGVADTLPLTLVPYNQRNSVGPEQAKQQQAFQVASQLAAKYAQIDSTDAYQWLLTRGFTDLATGGPLSVDRYYQSADANRGARNRSLEQGASVGAPGTKTPVDGTPDDFYQLSRRDLRDMTAYTLEARKNREDEAMRLVAQGVTLTPEFLRQNRIKPEDLEKRRDEYEMAKVQGQVNRDQLNRLIPQFVAQGNDPYRAAILARKRLGFMRDATGKDTADAELAAYDRLKNEQLKANAVSFDQDRGIADLQKMQIAGSYHLDHKNFDAEWQAKLDNDATRHVGRLLKRHGSALAVEAAKAFEADQEAARVERVKQMGWYDYTTSQPRQWVGNIAKGFVGLLISESLRGSVVYSKAAIDYLESVTGSGELWGKSKVEDHPWYKASREVDAWFKDTFTTNKDLDAEILSGQVPHAIGTSLAFIFPSLAKNPKAAIALMSTLQMGGGNFEEAIQAGASEEDAMRYALMSSAALGWTEILGISNAFTRLLKGVGGTTAKQFMREFLKTAPKEVAEEVFLNEGPQTVGQNILAQMTYDPDRKWDKGLASAIAVAALSAGTTSGFITGANTLRYQKAVQAQLKFDTANGGPSVRNLGAAGLFVKGKPQPITDDIKPLVDKHTENHDRIISNQEAIEKIRERAATLPVDQRLKLFRTVRRLQEENFELAQAQAKIADKIVDITKVPEPDILEQAADYEDARAAARGEVVAVPETAADVQAQSQIPQLTPDVNLTGAPVVEPQIPGQSNAEGDAYVPKSNDDAAIGDRVTLLGRGSGTVESVSDVNRGGRVQKQVTVRMDDGSTQQSYGAGFSFERPGHSDLAIPQPEHIAPPTTSEERFEEAKRRAEGPKTRASQIDAKATTTERAAPTQTKPLTALEKFNERKLGHLGYNEEQRAELTPEQRKQILKDRIKRSDFFRKTPKIIKPVTLEKPALVEFSVRGMYRKLKNSHNVARLRRAGWTFKNLNKKAVTVTGAPEGVLEANIAGGEFENAVYNIDTERTAQRKPSSRAGKPFFQAKKGQTQTLTELVRSLGGIRPDAADARSGKKRGNLYERLSGFPGIINKNADSNAEEMARRAVEFGYLQEYAEDGTNISPDEFLDLLEADARGISTFKSAEDQHGDGSYEDEILKGEHDRIRKDMLEELLADLTPEEMRRVESIADFLSDEEVWPIFEDAEFYGEISPENRDKAVKRGLQYGVEKNVTDWFIQTLKEFTDRQRAARESAQEVSETEPQGDQPGGQNGEVSEAAEDSIYADEFGDAYEPEDAETVGFDPSEFEDEEPDAADLFDAALAELKAESVPAAQADTPPKDEFDAIDDIINSRLNSVELTTEQKETYALLKTHFESAYAKGGGDAAAQTKAFLKKLNERFDLAKIEKLKPFIVAFLEEKAGPAKPDTEVVEKVAEPKKTTSEERYEAQKKKTTPEVADADKYKPQPLSEAPDDLRIRAEEMNKRMPTGWKLAKIGFGDGIGLFDPNDKQQGFNFYAQARWTEESAGRNTFEEQLYQARLVVAKERGIDAMAVPAVRKLADGDADFAALAKDTKLRWTFGSLSPKAWMYGDDAVETTTAEAEKWAKWAEAHGGKTTEVWNGKRITITIDKAEIQFRFYSTAEKSEGEKTEKSLFADEKMPIDRMQFVVYDYDLDKLDPENPGTALKDSEQTTGTRTETSEPTVQKTDAAAPDIPDDFTDAERQYVLDASGHDVPARQRQALDEIKKAKANPKLKNTVGDRIIARENGKTKKSEGFVYGHGSVGGQSVGYQFLIPSMSGSGGTVTWVNADDVLQTLPPVEQFDVVAPDINTRFGISFTAAKAMKTYGWEYALIGNRIHILKAPPNGDLAADLKKAGITDTFELRPVAVEEPTTSADRFEAEQQKAADELKAKYPIGTELMRGEGKPWVVTDYKEDFGGKGKLGVVLKRGSDGTIMSAKELAEKFTSPATPTPPTDTGANKADKTADISPLDTPEKLEANRQAWRQSIIADGGFDPMAPNTPISKETDRKNNALKIPSQRPSPERVAELEEMRKAFADVNSNEEFEAFKKKFDIVDPTPEPKVDAAKPKAEPKPTELQAILANRDTLSENALKVADTLADGLPHHIDTLLESTGLSFGALNTALVELDIADVIRVLPGKQYQLRDQFVPENATSLAAEGKAAEIGKAASNESEKEAQPEPKEKTLDFGNHEIEQLHANADNVRKLGWEWTESGNEITFTKIPDHVKDGTVRVMFAKAFLGLPGAEAQTEEAYAPGDMIEFELFDMKPRGTILEEHSPTMWNVQTRERDRLVPKNKVLRKVDSLIEPAPEQFDSGLQTDLFGNVVAPPKLPKPPKADKVESGSLFDMSGLDEEGLFAQGGPKPIEQQEAVDTGKADTAEDLLRRQAEAEHRLNTEAFGDEPGSWITEIANRHTSPTATDVAKTLIGKRQAIIDRGGPAQDLVADIVPAMLEAAEAETRSLTFDDYIRQSWLGKEDLTPKQREIYDRIAEGTFSQYFNDELNALEEVKNAPSGRTDLEEDSSGVGRIPDTVREEISEPGSVSDDPGTPEPSRQPETTETRPGSNYSLFGDGPIVSGEGSDIALRPEASADKGSAAGDTVDGRSGESFDPRASAEYKPSDATREEAERSGSDVIQKRIAQNAAEDIAADIGDLDNIRRTLPFLLPEQQDDVYFAEQRFAKSDGVMFTNATGTGKTYTGLGIVKRFHKQGKPNGIIIAPNDKILEDWRTSGLNLNVDIKRLRDTADHGRSGTVATTYANFRANASLLERNWDFIIFDEAHNLSQNKSGDMTASVDMMRAAGLHPEGAWSFHQMKNAEPIEEVRQNALELAKRQKNYWRVPREERPEFDRKTKELEELLEGLRRKLTALEEAAFAEFAERRKLHKPAKVTFLSATPFAYVKSVEYAEGYLFSFERDKDGKLTQGHGYNEPDGRQKFFIEHFGYRMRYNELTEPDVDVNNELMEQTFNTYLKKNGALSGRKLDVDVDYSRQFIVIDSAIGSKIDDGFNHLHDAKKIDPDTGKEKRKYAALEEFLSGRFNYLARRFTLEAINARAAIPIIRQHLAAGRKVVVFHDYNKNEAIHPFYIDQEELDGMFGSKGASIRTQYEQFLKERPDLLDLDLSSLEIPAVLFQREFGSMLAEFSGKITNKKKRRAAVDDFNSDHGEIKVLLAQSDAGREGISLHDTTGKYQRVLINLGLPVRPIAATQTEGRIYRVGTMTHAIQQYITTGTDFERRTFGEKISQRAGTAENLAMGEEARALRQAIIDGYNSAISEYAPNDDEGVGGKEADKRIAELLSEFEKAKSFYFGQQKKTSANKAAEGADYFATPEPLGLKMVEWANQRHSEHALEPSAGHGAIARFFRSDNRKTFVEPSNTLSARLSLVSDGRIVQEPFEDLSVGANKFDTIVMNPPFGSGGKTAVEHLAKAFKHLNNGGRVVALIPAGPAADKQLAKFLESDAAKHIYQVADIKLPQSTFKRAGTSVSTHILVLEKQLFKPDADKVSVGDEYDFTDAENIKDLFDLIEDVEMPSRIDPTFDAKPQPAAITTDRDAVIEPTPRPIAEARLDADSSLFDKAEFNHTKTGEPIFAAKLKAFDDVNFKYFRYTIAPRYGGYFSSYKGSGAVPGFHFKTPEAREQFIQEAEQHVASKRLSSAIVSEQALERAQYQPPYTTSVLQNEQFKSLAGRSVKVDTIRQVLKQQSVKAIERDIVNTVLEDPAFIGQETISFDAFKQAVRLELMPLRVIESSSYSSYGLDNTGIGELEQELYRARLLTTKGGRGSQWSWGRIVDMVKATGFDTKWQGEGEWHVVLGNNNTYGTHPEYPAAIEQLRSLWADTAEAVDEYNTYMREGIGQPPRMEPRTHIYNTDLEHGVSGHFSGDFSSGWVNEGAEWDIEEREQNGRPLFIVIRKGSNPTTEQELQDNLGTVATTREEADEWVKTFGGRHSRNRGMFGHTRVAYAGDKGIIVELQSDVYQKHKAEELAYKSFLEDISRMPGGYRDAPKDSIKGLANTLADLGPKLNVNDAIFNAERRLEAAKNEAVHWNQAVEEVKPLGPIVKKYAKLYNDGLEEIRNIKEPSSWDGSGPWEVKTKEGIYTITQNRSSLGQAGFYITYPGEKYTLQAQKIRWPLPSDAMENIRRGAIEQLVKDLIGQLKAEKAHALLSDQTLNAISGYFHTASTNSADAFIFDAAKNHALGVTDGDFDGGVERLTAQRDRTNSRVENAQEVVDGEEYQEFKANKIAHDKARAALLAALPLKYKQFIAHRKNYTARLLREEVRNMAQKGLKEAWVVTPRTAALVEGFLYDQNAGNGESIPYTLPDGSEPTSDMDLGDELMYLGKKWTVVEQWDSSFLIAPSDEVYIYDEQKEAEHILESAMSDAKDALQTEEGHYLKPDEIQDLIRRQDGVSNRYELLEPSGIFEMHPDDEADEALSMMNTRFKFEFKAIEDEIRESIANNNGFFEVDTDRRDWEHVEDLGNGRYQYVEKGTDTETLEQPDQYAKPTDVSDFKLEDYSGTQRTILEKYVELNDLVKKEYENVEVKTDPRGNEYLAFPIAEDTLDRGVRLFSRELSTAQQARVSDLGFYSGVEQAILDKMPEKAKAAQIRGILKPENGVKQEELDWLDINSFLQQNSDFTKQEVLDYVRANQVDVQEVVLGDRPARDERSPANPNSGDMQERLDAAIENLKDLFSLGDWYDLAVAGDRPEADVPALLNRFAEAAERGDGLDASLETIFDADPDHGDEPGLFGLTQEDYDELETSWDDVREARRQADIENNPYAETGEGEAKFKQYTLPGGENYRELLLTMPARDNVTRTEAKTPQGWGDTDGGNVGFVEHGNTGADFRSSHFDEPNILAHIRFDTRDGGRRLHIAEIQSDWGQKLREELPLREVAKPEGVRKLAENFFSRKQVAVMPLNAVDGGVLAALQNDKVQDAVIALLPVDVVDNLALVKASPKKFFGNPNVIISRLAADHGSGVASAVGAKILDAARVVGTDLRAKLLTGLNAGGGDVLLLPALKASDLSAREITGLLAPELIYHDEGLLGTISEGGTQTGTKETAAPTQITGGKVGRNSTSLANFLSSKLPTFIGANAGSGTARPNAESGPASVANLLEWHKSIITKKEGRTPEYIGGNTPNMPFVRSWAELSFKRVLRYAVDHGYESISWDTGATQADRYDLRQEVNAIHWQEKVNLNTGGVFKEVVVDYKHEGLIVDFRLDANGLIHGSALDTLNGKSIEEATSKDIAKRIVDEPSGTVEGEGLKVGGSGMAGFYDKMIPSFANKYTKKWGGKVELSTPSDGSKKRPSPIAQTGSGEFMFLDPDGEQYRFATREDAESYRKQIMDVGTEVHELKITPEMKLSVARGQKLFAKRTGETAKLLTDVLPQAHTSVILAGIKSTLVGSELEMTPHAMETVRLLDNEIEYRNYRDRRLKNGDSIEDIDREFDEQHLGSATAGFTNDTRSFAIMAQVGDEMRLDYSRAGYTDEDLVGYDELIRNLHTLAETVDFGIVYVFDDILPEERFHVEDLRAGRTDRQALEELQENGIWKNVGMQFAMEYGDLNPADKASEIAAKLATGQAAKYGWDKRPDFAEQSKTFLDAWYDGILRRNAVFIEENGIEAFKDKFRRISNAKTTAGNGKGTTKTAGNKRTNGRSGGKSKGARTKQQTAKEGSQNAPRSDRRKAQKLSLEQERQFAEALGVDPAKVRIKLRRHAQTLRDNGRDVNDVPFVPGSDEERIREAKNILLDSLLAADESGFTQGDYDYALEQFFNPDIEPRTKTVLGIALIDHLGSTGDLEMMNSIADRTIVHVGEAAQALQAASIAAKYDFSRGVLLAKKALEKQGKKLTQENIDEIKKLTQQYAKSQREKALLAQMLSDAEDVIAEQQAELDEAQQAVREAVNDLGATAAEQAEIAAALEEALEENEEKDGFIENLKRQVARWKAKAMSDSTNAVRMSTARKQLLSEIPMIKAELAKMFPGKALKSAEGGKLRSVESSENFDDEHRTYLVKYIAYRIFEGDGYQETIDMISDLTGGVLNTDEIRALHNDAETFTEGEPVEKSPEAIAKQKKRSEHKKAAAQFRKDAGIDVSSSKAGRKASRVAGVKEFNSLEKEILKLAEGNEMLGAAAIFYNKAMSISDWYDMVGRGYPDLTPSQQNDLFAKARQLRDQARENRTKFILEQKGVIKGTKEDFEEFKKQKYITDSVLRKHKGTLDAMYRKHQKNLAQQTVAAAEQIAGVPKGLSATGELSMILRQNGLLLLTHPIRTFAKLGAVGRGLGSEFAGAKAGAWTKGTMLGSVIDEAGMWSETKLLEYMEGLRNDPYFDDAQAHGLEFTNIGDFNIADEHFVANVFIAMADARKVWMLNKKANNQTLDTATDIMTMPLRIFGRTYKAIEIANTLFGDAARLATYRYYAEHIGNDLDAFESRKAKRYAARAVNAFGGRGDIGSVLGSGGIASKLANISLFSARLLISRPQSLFYLTTGFALAPKGMRVQMALDGAKFYAFITMLALLAGLRLNPWDKDFGKMKYGPRDLNIDILAGMDAPLQWLFGVASGTVQQIGAMARGESSDAIEENFERLFNKYWFNVDMAKKSGNWLEGLRYWRGKSSPAVSLGFDYFTGKDFIGRPFGWKNALASRMIPLSYTQTYNALYYDRFASVMKEPSVATGELDVINGLITIIGTGVGVGLSQYPNEDNSYAETLAWEMWEPFPGREMTQEEKTAAIEEKRITTGLRNLYRMKTKAEAEGKPTAAIDAAIKIYSEKYAVDAKTAEKLKTQGTAGDFDFVTEKFTLAQIDKLLEVATLKERLELRPIRAAKLAGAEKKAKKEQEPPKPLAVRLNNADVEDAAKLYNENQSTFTSEQRFEARRKLMQKVLNSHQRGQLSREAYDAAKAVLGDEIRFQYVERPRRERAVRGLDSLKGVQ